jgi:prepilin-type N-terminal cleavage/methylation domain-containing protein
MTTISATDDFIPLSGIGRCAHGSAGFTLIELLVVMAIIAGLVAILVPTVNSSLKRAKTVRAATDVKSLEAAWKGYFQEYGKWPLDGSHTLLGQDTDEDAADSKGIETTEDVVALLSGSNLSVGHYDPNTHNPRLIQFMEFQDSSLNPGGDFVDPYGSRYKFMLDVNYDNRVNQRTFARFGATAPSDKGILKSVVAWSRGPDGQDATDDGNADSLLSRDDIRSWQ